MDAAYRSTKSPFSGASPTQLVAGKRAPEYFSSYAIRAHEKDQVLAAALSEYCRLKEDGVAPAVDEFCRRFPTYHKSIQRMIDVEETLGKLDDFEDTAWPEVGSSFMGFDVLHELGVGAFARVYLAAEPALGGRLVAVKVAMYGSDEAETLGKLDHPNVVPVHSVRDDPESGMTAVCMPYLGSATLSDVIEQVFQEGIPQQGSAVLEAVAHREIVGDAKAGVARDEVRSKQFRGSYVDAVVRLGTQMAEALVYTHAHGVLHRDLKPSNVLITPAGQPKLLDFNLSCDVETEVIRLGGTLPYMPPEQINDVFLRPFDAQPPTDPRSDLFSLGVILYELFTGQLPFGHPPTNLPPIEAAKIYLRAQQAPPRPIQSLNPAVELQTARLIERCISPNPDCRPSDAAVLVTELRRHFAVPQQLSRWWEAYGVMLAVVSFVMFANLMAHLQTRPPLDRRLYDRGLRAMANKDYMLAIKYFDHAAELNEDEPAIPFARGLCHHARENDELAVRDLVSIARGDCEPIIKEVYGYACLAAGKFTSSYAGPPYTELVNASPDDLALRVNLALGHFGRTFGSGSFGGPPVNAFNEANTILQMDPNCGAAYHLRAMCTCDYLINYGLGDLVDVLQDVETALAMGASTVDLELNRMLLLKMIADKDPQLRDDVKVELRSNLSRAASHFQTKKLEELAARFELDGDRAWLDATKARCRKTRELRPFDYLAHAPNANAIRERLERTWSMPEDQRRPSSPMSIFP